jgi:hypothetical protein
MAKITKKHAIYPLFEVENIKKPKKYYAFPIGGLLLKLILLIPVWIEMVLLSIVAFFILIINWFVIISTGKYWDTAYNFFLGFMRLQTKVALFIMGLTDQYPGFSLSTDKRFKLDIEKPKNPNKWLAFPVLGFVVRVILLIPYFIFSNVLSNGAFVAVIISWFTVTFKNKYPESLFEFERDTLRVSNAADAYMLGLKDNYPSFYISMDHQTIKILLIIAGALLVFSNWGDGSGSNSYQPSY